MNTTTNTLVTFYGDDFTGSTDVLESLSRNGVRTVLFLETPKPDDLDEFADEADPIRAVGVAGTSRTMSSEEMDETLPQLFEALSRFDPELVHYKVCSTFDSSTSVGSIGHAIDIGQERFDSPFVPVVVAAPSLDPRGRYVLFGNLFATVDGTTYRLDRHPTMKDHPVTPMTEADLTRHLAEQTDRDIGLLDIRSVDGSSVERLAADLNRVTTDDEIVVFDGLNHEHQRRVGTLVWERSVEADGPLFSASSSGLSYALTAHWHDADIVPESDRSEPMAAVDRVVAMSGSAAPVTAHQIDWALNNGFGGVRLDTAALIDPRTSEDAKERAVDAALDVLNAGRSVICYTARGPDDPAIDATVTRGESLGLEVGEISDRIGTAQGRIMCRLLEETGIRRACIAGGDTSGAVTPHLDVYALEFVAPVGPGSPLCRAASRDPTFDGLEIALKGGQVQTVHERPDYFGVVKAGGLSRPSRTGG